MKKRVIVIGLTLLILCTMIIWSVSTAYADSTNRIQVLLQLSAKGSVVDGDMDDLKPEEIRFLGVYLSNFYVPFYTDLGKQTKTGSGVEDNEDLYNGVKDAMKEALSNNLYFSSDLADAVVETIIGLSRNDKNRIELYTCVLDGSGSYQSINDYVPANYYNFLRLMMGRGYYSSSNIDKEMTGPLNSYFDDKGNIVGTTEYIDNFRNTVDNVIDAPSYEEFTKKLASPSRSSVAASSLTVEQLKAMYNVWLSKGTTLEYEEHLAYLMYVSGYAVIDIQNSIFEEVTGVDVQTIGSDSKLKTTDEYFAFLKRFIDSNEEYKKHSNDVYVSLGVGEEEAVQEKEVEDLTQEDIESSSRLSIMAKGSYIMQRTCQPLDSSFKSFLDKVKETDSEEKIYFCYQGKDGLTPVFDCYANTSQAASGHFTASQTVFFYLLQTMISTSNFSYVFSYFNCTQSELENFINSGLGTGGGDGENSGGSVSLGKGATEYMSDKDLTEKVLNLVTEELAYKLSIYNVQMTVDCFGNIWADGAQHCFIAVPGCINPYMWIPVDSNGKEINDTPVGSAINIANAFMLRNIEGSSSIFENNEYTERTDSGQENIADGRFYLGGVSDTLTSFRSTNSFSEMSSFPLVNFRANEINGESVKIYSDSDSIFGIHLGWKNADRQYSLFSAIADSSFAGYILKNDKDLSYYNGARNFYKGLVSPAINTLNGAYLLYTKNDIKTGNNIDEAFYGKLYGFPDNAYQIHVNSPIDLGAGNISQQFKIPTLHNWVYIDNLGAFEGNGSSDDSSSDDEDGEEESEDSEEEGEEQEEEGSEREEEQENNGERGGENSNASISAVDYSAPMDTSKIDFTIPPDPVLIPVETVVGNIDATTASIAVIGQTLSRDFTEKYLKWLDVNVLSYTTDKKDDFIESFMSENNLTTDKDKSTLNDIANQMSTEYNAYLKFDKAFAEWLNSYNFTSTEKYIDDRENFISGYFNTNKINSDAIKDKIYTKAEERDDFSKEEVEEVTEKEKADDDSTDDTNNNTNNRNNNNRNNTNNNNSNNNSNNSNNNSNDNGVKKNKNIDWQAFNVESIVDDNGGFSSDYDSPFVESGSNDGEGATGGGILDTYSTSKQFLNNISTMGCYSLYVTYVFAQEGQAIGELGYKMNLKGMPDINDTNPIFDNALLESEVDQELLDIKHWTYYLLHPTEGFNYVRTLLTNKVNHLLLGWHSDIVGTNGVGATVGVTRYRATMGYVTMPDLSEMQWTASMINIYNTAIPFIIIAMIVVMIFAFITGTLSLQHALIGAVIFGVFTLIPVNLINAVVGYSNSISGLLYGDKFVYWALVQQESYSSAIDEAAQGDTYENYLRTLYAANNDVYLNQGNESILMKWQAPKKMSSLVLTQKDANALNGNGSLPTLSKWMQKSMNIGYSGESYLDNPEAVYMFRSYIDISNFSRYIYDGIINGGIGYNSESPSLSNMTNVNANLENWRSDYSAYIGNGYTNSADSGLESSSETVNYVLLPISSKIYDNALSTDISKFTQADANNTVAINQDIFNFGIPSFTKYVSSGENVTDGGNSSFSVDQFAATGGINKDTERYTDLSKFMLGEGGTGVGFTDQDYAGLAAYGLYSENVFYYFSWLLYDWGLEPSATSSNGFKDMILGNQRGGFFYNNNGNGELKDIMDMKSLFTVIIPYLKAGNDLVRQWDELYGINIYEGVATEEGHWSDYENDEELLRKYWHNLNVSRLYCLYTPWVDVMYDCSYAKPCDITALGMKYHIEDPLDPGSYPVARPMIFSESEMVDYGLTEGDLTAVERLILKANKGYQERLFDLLNYYTFSDTVLDTAAAMECAFVFNNTFSESGLFQDNHVIYPQSFDLSNFSYDAFLRFILANNTGESMLTTLQKGGEGTSTGKSSGDFYETIVNKSSVVTVIVMLILDIISMYIVPGFRIIFLISIFLMSVLIILTSIFRIESSMKFFTRVLKQFILPLLGFFAITVGFSFILSMFMGVGNDAVTGQSKDWTIQTGDPVIAMFLMLALNIVQIVLYWKILKYTFSNIKSSAKGVGGFIGGLGSAAVGFAGGLVAAGAFAGRGVASVGRKVYDDYHVDTDNRSVSIPPAQVGTGVESSSAADRSAHSASSISNHEERVNNAWAMPFPGSPSKSAGQRSSTNKPDNRSSNNRQGNSTQNDSNNVSAEMNRDSQSFNQSENSRRRNQSRSERMKEHYDNYVDKNFGYAKDSDGNLDVNSMTARDYSKYKRRYNSKFSDSYNSQVVKDEKKEWKREVKQSKAEEKQRQKDEKKNN